MDLTTILNRCHRLRGFVYEHAVSVQTRGASKGRATAQRFSRSLLAVPFACTPDTTNSPSGVLSSSLCGDSSFSCCTRCDESIGQRALAVTEGTYSTATR